MGHLCPVSFVSNSVGTGGEGGLRSPSTESLAAHSIELSPVANPAHVIAHKAAPACEV